MKSLKEFLTEDVVASFTYYDEHKDDLLSALEQVKNNSITADELFELVRYSGDIGVSMASDNGTYTAAHPGSRRDQAIKVIEGILKKTGVRDQNDLDLIISACASKYLNGNNLLWYGNGFSACKSCPAIDSLGWNKVVSVKKILKARSKYKDDRDSLPEPRYFGRSTEAVFVKLKKPWSGFDAVCFANDGGVFEELTDVLYDAAGIISF